MIDQLATAALLGAFRGEAAVDRDALAAVLVAPRTARRRAARRRERRRQPADRHADGEPVAVDALVEVGVAGGSCAPPCAPRPDARAVPRPVRAARRARRRRLVATPASSASSSLHNLLASGYEGRGLRHQPAGRGRCSASRPSPTSPSSPTTRSTSSFVCTPASANVGAAAGLRGKGRRAAFVTSAGYGEAGDEGGRAEAELVALGDELGILLAGPNGQGVVSTPVHALRPDRRARTRRPGASASPARAATSCRASSTSPAPRASGVSRAVSAGNAAAVDGRRLPRPTTPTTRRPPSAWPTSRASTTAAALFDALGRGGRRASRWCWSRAGPPRAGRGRPPATPARSPPTTRCSTGRAGPPASPGRRRSRRRSRPPPRSPPSRRRRGPNVVVLTTAGGWGVVTADAIARDRDLRPARAARRPRAPPSTRCCRRDGAATTRSTAPAARRVTPFPT